jgi:hypothetical protein
LEAFHHPYYANNQSRIQSAMFQEAERWLRDLGDDVARQTINALTKVSCIFSFSGSFGLFIVCVGERQRGEKQTAWI